MSHKEGNPCIRCRVASCSYHCDSDNYCTLGAIQVEPCLDCGNGRSCDESMCASYRRK